MTAQIEPPCGATLGSAWRRHILYVALAVGVIDLAAVLELALKRDPRELPSTVIGRPTPDSSLPSVQDRMLGFASTDPRGEVSSVNMLASWCAACRSEHPLLMAMGRSGAATIHGLNYKDAPPDAARWLNMLGDPYVRTGADRDWRVGVEWGLYGVPETYVVSADGRVMHKHAGPLTEQVRDATILPLIERLRRGVGRRSP